MPSEFDSVSEKIKEQLGVLNNYSAETNAALEEAKREAQIQQEKIKVLMEQATTRAQNKTIGSSHQKYRIPRGSIILIPKLPEDVHPTTLIDGRDFETITSSKDVVYDADDVCMNPITGECMLDSLRLSIWYKEKSYFAFFLPKNNKKIPFILVSRFKVQIQEEAEDDYIRRIFTEGSGSKILKKSHFGGHK